MQNSTLSANATSGNGTFYNGTAEGTSTDFLSIMLNPNGNFLLTLTFTENYAGFPSFCSLIMLISVGRWRPRMNYKSLIKFMVYFDCIAVTVGWLNSLTSDYTTNCQQTFMYWTSDMTFSFKDSMKMAYLIWKWATVTKPFPEPYRHIATISAGLCSLVLYQMYLWPFYNLWTPDCTGTDMVMPADAILISLYSLWLLIELITATGLALFLWEHVVQMKKILAVSASGCAELQKDRQELTHTLKQEVFRVIWSAVIGLVVCAAAVIETITKKKVLYLRGTFFTIGQFILVSSLMDTGESSTPSLL